MPPRADGEDDDDDNDGNNDTAAPHRLTENEP